MPPEMRRFGNIRAIGMSIPKSASPRLIQSNVRARNDTGIKKNRSKVISRCGNKAA